MDFATIVLVSVGLAMDAFAVSICKGLALKKADAKSKIVIGLWFGGFQFLMPIIGYGLGNTFYDYISDYDHWVAFLLLAAIGLNMIRESFHVKEEEEDADLGAWVMLLLAIAVSIDALAVGITLAMDGSDILTSSATIGIITFSISVIGVKIGGIAGDRFSGKAEIIGGTILILIGIKILLEHLGFL